MLVQCGRVGGADGADEFRAGEEAAVDEVGGLSAGFERVGSVEGEDVGVEGERDEGGFPGWEGGSHVEWRSFTPLTSGCFLLNAGTAMCCRCASDILRQKPRGRGWGLGGEIEEASED